MQKQIHFGFLNPCIERNENQAHSEQILKHDYG